VASRSISGFLPVAHLAEHISAKSHPITPNCTQFTNQEFYGTKSHPENKAEILTTVDMAEASIALGEGRTITQESMRQLAGEVKQRGLARLVSKTYPPR
jgi:hypothetical protein